MNSAYVPLTVHDYSRKTSLSVNSTQTATHNQISTHVNALEKEWLTRTFRIFTCVPFSIPSPRESLSRPTSHTMQANQCGYIVGIMHMLTIVHMLYLSSNSLFMHRWRDQNEENSGGMTRLTDRGYITYSYRDERRSLDIRALKNSPGVCRRSRRTYDARRCNQSQHLHNCGALVQKVE